MKVFLKTYLKQTFNATINKLTEPIDSPFGPSLIYVNEIISEKEIKIEEIKDQIISDIQKDKARIKFIIYIPKLKI